MNDPNDQVPLDRPTIPRFGGLNDLPELPPIPTAETRTPPALTAHEPRIQPTPATPIPAPPRVMVDLPKPSPSVRIDAPKPTPTPPITTHPVAKVPLPAPALISDTPPEPRWVKEALLGFVKPTKKAAALGTAICLIGGAFGFQYFFTGKIPTREVAGTAPTTVAREVAGTSPTNPTHEAKEDKHDTKPATTHEAASKPNTLFDLPVISVPAAPAPAPTATPLPMLSESVPGNGFFTLAVLDSYVDLRRLGMSKLSMNSNEIKPNFAVPNINSPAAPSGLNMPSIPSPSGNFQPIVDNKLIQAKAETPVAVPALPTTPMPVAPILPTPMPEAAKPPLPDVAMPVIPAPVTPVQTTPAPTIPTPAPTTPNPLTVVPVVPVVKPTEPNPMPVVPAPAVTIPKPIEPANFEPKTVPTAPAMPNNVISTPMNPTTLSTPAPTTLNGNGFEIAKPAVPEAPAIKPMNPEPATMNLSKPPGANVPTPVPTPLATPTNLRSDFDVDIHVVKPGESYDAISERHYGSAKFAAALREFNRNRELVNGNEVEVPPLTEMRKRLGTNTVRPVNPSPTGTPWNTAPGRTAPAPRTYRIPQDGMSMWDVAKAVYGEEKAMTKIRQANSTLDPNAKFRAGDTVNLPADAPTVR